MTPASRSPRSASTLLFSLLLVALGPGVQARTAKPVLHGQHWVAITGKPLAATAGATIFQQGGNAVDAACAMIAATSTMWDTYFAERTSGPINAIYFDREHGTMWGGSSHHGDDYGIAW